MEHKKETNHHQHQNNTTKSDHQEQIKSTAAVSLSNFLNPYGYGRYDYVQFLKSQKIVQQAAAAACAAAVVAAQHDKLFNNNNNAIHLNKGLIRVFFYNYHCIT
jgi:hypothetical protein